METEPDGVGGGGRVLLVCSTALPHRRAVVAGVLEYARERAGWALEHVADAGDLRWRWAARGLAGAVVESDQFTPAVGRRLAVPRVLVGHEPRASAGGASGGEVRVQVDDAAVASMAADHLLEGRPRSLGHVGPSPVSFCAEREAVLSSRASGAGATPAAFDTTAGPAGGAMRRRLERWLLDLPKPAAVVTAGQTLGRQVVGAARHLGLAVPEDVAVLAVGEDELLCRLSVPALSAIDPNGRQVGWRAAEALDGLLRGGGAPDPPAVRRVPPADLVARRSSDVRRIGHPAVRAAVELIRDRATLGLTAADVLARATVPRRTLEVAFRRHLGRTIYGEITRARVEHAKRLLRAGPRAGVGVGPSAGRGGGGGRGGGADSILDVALASGFSGGGAFAEVFRRVVGESPRDYRARHRPAPRA